MLRLMKDQGVFQGDITLLQRHALHIANLAEKSDTTSFAIDFAKSIQLFINPPLYDKLYSAEINAEEEEAEFSEEDYNIDLSSPEDIDDYLERIYAQKESVNSRFTNTGQVFEVNVDA